MRRAFLALATATILSSVGSGPLAHAVTAADWHAELIISDSQFTDANSMSTPEVDAFLKRLLPSCDRWGAKASEYGGGSRADYALSTYGVRTPFTCLTEYYEVPKTAPSLSTPVNNYGKFNSDGTPQVPSGAISVAQMISNSARKYQISPKALIIKLATESPGPLTRDDWPMPNQYLFAMGAHCPDDGPNGSANCRAEWSGFSLQMDEAANLLRGYLNNMDQDWWPYRRLGPGVDLVKKDRNGVELQDLCSSRMGLQNSNCVGWNVPESCRGTVLNIQSKATAALYTYTPYQPNHAALLNMYGTGDSCSAYGNRNFWRVWNDWFGPSTDFKFTPLDNPRWMSLISDATKYNPLTGESTGASFPAGKQLRFVDKVFFNNKWYFRTEFDSANGSYQAFDSANVADIKYESLDDPRFMMTTQSMSKVQPSSGKKTSTVAFDAGTYVQFTSKIFVNGQWYFRTAFDTANNNDSTFLATNVSDISFTPLDNPRYMRTTEPGNVINLRTNQTNSVTPSASDQFMQDKVYLNGEWYFRTKTDSVGGPVLATKSTAFRDISFTPLSTPYSVSVVTSTYKVDPFADKQIGTASIVPGSIIQVAGIVSVNNVNYYQTEFDRTRGVLNSGIKATDTVPYRLTYIPLETPRNLSTTTTVKKVNLKTGEPTAVSIDPSLSIRYTTKTEVAGKWYLRTEFDTNNGTDNGIPIEYLKLQ